MLSLLLLKQLLDDSHVESCALLLVAEGSQVGLEQEMEGGLSGLVPGVMATGLIGLVVTRDIVLIISRSMMGCRTTLTLFLFLPVLHALGSAPILAKTQQVVQGMCLLDELRKRVVLGFLKDLVFGDHGVGPLAGRIALPDGMVSTCPSLTASLRLQELFETDPR